MLLEGKVAVIYGAGGPIGGAVTHAFAREGLEFFSPVAPRPSWIKSPTRFAGMAGE
jgi:NAD(P)-dependent dehydrogenase (short-subunit alcohol dehydrogenase family)